MSKTLKTVVAVLTLVSMGGCATIVAGGPDKFQINSNPQGAKVYMNGQYMGETPTVITIGRKDDAEFRLEKEGYETSKFDRNKVVNGWIFGNILLGGLVGLTIDLITSNQGKYSDSPVTKELLPQKRTPASAKTKAAAQ